MLRDGNRLESVDGGWMEVSKTTVLGRLEVLAAQHRGCGCSQLPFSTQDKCKECTKMNQWTTSTLSRQLLRISYQDPGTWSLQIRGSHTRVLRNGIEISGTGDSWSPKVCITDKDIIRLQSVKDFTNWLDLEVVDDIPSQGSVHTEKQVETTQPANKPNLPVRPLTIIPMNVESGSFDSRDKCTTSNLSTTTLMVSNLPNLSGLHVRKPTRLSLGESSSKPASNSAKVNDVSDSSPVQEPKHPTSASQPQTPPSPAPRHVAKFSRFSEDCGTTSHFLPSPPEPSEQQQKPSAPISFLEKSKSLISQADFQPASSWDPAKQKVPSLPGKPSPFPTRPVSSVEPLPPNKQQRDSTPGGRSLLLVPLGLDLSSVRRTLLAQKAHAFGMRVVQNVFEANTIVVSQQVTSLNEVSQILNVDEHQLRNYIEKNDVSCVIPSWLASAKRASWDDDAPPSLMHVWHGDVHKRRRISSDPVREKQPLRYKRNLEIAEVFKTLSGLHQSCPLLEVDPWKAYMFRIVSGRIMNLDFEISRDPETLRRLSGIIGIGTGSMNKIKEYLETGTLTRIREFETDPQRVAMKKLMDIWGVGRVKALDLLRRGHSTVESVRDAVKRGEHLLDRNQLVGLDSYEDLLEEMDRKEVERIGEIVKAAAEEACPGAEVRIMGSFRRLKFTCGDVDVHITHRAHRKQIPEFGLAKIVDILWEQGHLMYHLTFFPGMSSGRTPEDYMRSSRHIPEEAWAATKVPGYMSSKGSRSSSYMGVLRSPVVAGKRRRVDIKFYPYRERIFASLYFTGNGFFNRSMRLWAVTRHRFTLNDHGLFHEGTVDRVMEANKEKEVFDKLGLIYKEPHERDSFDAVEAKDGSAVLEMSQSQFFQDAQHVWVS